MRFISTANYAILVFIALVDIVLDMFDLDNAAFGVLYTCAILLVLDKDKKTVLNSAYFATFLIIADFIITFLNGQNTTAIFFNSLVAALVLTMSTVLILRYKRIQQQSKKKKEEYIQSLEKMLFITSHKVRSPLCSLQGIVNLVNEEEDPLLLKQYSVEIRSCLDKMDAFTRELNTFISSSEEKQQMDEEGLNADTP